MLFVSFSRPAMKAALTMGVLYGRASSRELDPKPQPHFFSGPFLPLQPQAANCLALSTSSNVSITPNTTNNNCSSSSNLSIGWQSGSRATQVQCPHCMRSFSPAAGPTHIAICAKVENRPKSAHAAAAATDSAVRRVASKGSKVAAGTRGPHSAGGKTRGAFENSEVGEVGANVAAVVVLSREKIWPRVSFS